MNTSYCVRSIVAVLFLLIGFGCSPKEGKGFEENANSPVLKSPEGDKLVIYQLMVRLFGNQNATNKTFGTLEENGSGKMNDISDKALSELRTFGITHVWFTGLLDHATMSAFPDANIEADDADVVKGRAGSPYAIKDYYDIAPSLATEALTRMEEFDQLVQRSHNNQLKVIIDFVPNHVARAYHADVKPVGVEDLGASDDTKSAFAANNNFYYIPKKKFKVPDYDPLGEEKAPGENGKFKEKPAKATGNNVFSNEPSVDDWFETVKLNYGIENTDSGQVKHFTPIPSTWTKMRDILLFWAGKGVDGFRCDMAEMVPVEFWEWAIADVKKQYPEVIFIAEIYNPLIYHDFVAKGGFDYLYDKVGVYDRIRPLMEGRETANTNAIVEAMAQSEGIEEKMLRFLENHDEQRIASSFFAGDAKAAIPGMTVTALLGRGPVMLYFGQESGEKGEGEEGFQGEDGRTTIFDYWGVPAHQQWMNGGKFDGGKLSATQLELRDFYAKLIHICRYHPAAAQGAFLNIPQKDIKTMAFIRYTPKRRLLIVANFNKTAEAQVAIKLPAEAWEKMKLQSNENYFLADLLKEKLELELQGEATQSREGFAINVPAWGAYVFELEQR